MGNYHEEREGGERRRETKKNWVNIGRDKNAYEKKSSVYSLNGVIDGRY